MSPSSHRTPALRRPPRHLVSHHLRRPQATDDGNGNVRALVKANAANPAASAVMEKYAYDGFGREVAVRGADAGVNSFRFSTKQLDVETGMNYYGYRFYAAGVGRWINRDPIVERGGINLYTSCNNDDLNKIDKLGLQTPQEIINEVMQSYWPSLVDQFNNNYHIEFDSSAVDASEYERKMQDTVCKSTSQIITYVMSYGTWPMRVNNTTTLTVTTTAKNVAPIAPVKQYANSNRPRSNFIPLPVVHQCRIHYHHIHWRH